MIGVEQQLLPRKQTNQGRMCQNPSVSCWAHARRTADFILNWKLSIFEHWGLSCDRAWHFKIGIFALNKEGFGVSVDVPEVVCKGTQLRNRHIPVQMWVYKPTHYQNRNLNISAIYTQLEKSQLWSLSLQEIEIYVSICEIYTIQYIWIEYT